MNSPVILPDCYEWVDARALTETDVSTLHESVGWEVNKQLLRNVEIGADILLGVQHEGTLVGTAVLAGERERRRLSSLAVHPDHRSRGIGSTIVRERVRIAKEAKVFIVYTELDPTNTLVQLYESLGFVQMTPNQSTYVLHM